MPKRDTVRQLDKRIASAWAAVQGARAAARHSPNGSTVAVLDMAEHALDELLEARHEMTSMVNA